MHLERLKTLVMSLNNEEIRNNDLINQLKSIEHQIMLIRSDLVKQGKIDGRNKETREAQMYPYIENLLTKKMATQKELAISNIELNHLKRLYEIGLLEAEQ
jgi:hypothetical protein